MKVGILAAVVLALAASQAMAVDGVIEINQARALAGGVTPGDTPGFPVSITQAGSYRLTGSLETGNLPGIDISANDVTLDLNGFSLGSDFVGGPSFGIRGGASNRNIRVENGLVRLFLAEGIDLGNRSIVRNVRVESCGGGILLGNDSEVTSCLSRDNGKQGIRVGDNSKVINSTAIDNSFDGIEAGDNCTLTGNTVYSNSQDGIDAGSGCTVSGNVVGSNSARGIAVLAGCVLANNTAHSNGTTSDHDGINCFQGCVTTNNSSRSNKGDGIDVGDGSIVTGNTSNNNEGVGIRMQMNCGLRDNVMGGNTGGTVQGGFATGTNICNGSTVCP